MYTYNTKFLNSFLFDFDMSDVHQRQQTNPFGWKWWAKCGTHFINSFTCCHWEHFFLEKYGSDDCYISISGVWWQKKWKEHEPFSRFYFFSIIIISIILLYIWPECVRRYKRIFPFECASFDKSSWTKRQQSFVEKWTTRL